MVRLEYSEVLKRKIRKDPWDEIGVSTYVKINEAIQAGRLEEAMDLVDYLKPEGERVHNIMGDFIYALINYIAETMGEEEVEKAFRYMGEKFYPPGKDVVPAMSPEEILQYRCESFRAHRSGPGGMGNITVVEEPDRFVMYLDPCGTGGHLRRAGRLDPPYNFGKTKKPYPWSWGKANVPYFCVHCCLFSELMPIEWVGYPLRVCEFSENPDDPCVMLFYKEPELIPEKYFERLGKKKDISKFKKR